MDTLTIHQIKALHTQYSNAYDKGIIGIDKTYVQVEKDLFNELTKGMKKEDIKLDRHEEHIALTTIIDEVKIVTLI